MFSLDLLLKLPFLCDSISMIWRWTNSGGKMSHFQFRNRRWIILQPEVLLPSMCKKGEMGGDRNWNLCWCLQPTSAAILSKRNLISCIQPPILGMGNYFYFHQVSASPASWAPIIQLIRNETSSAKHWDFTKKKG